MRDWSKAKVNNGATRNAQSDALAPLMGMLAANMKAIKSALPKHLTPERVARVALNTIRKTPKLCQCQPATLCAAIMEASSLGLEIDMRGQAYLVPFWNSKTGTNDVQLIIGYKGMMDLAYRSGKVSQIYADVVGENDVFDVTLGLEPNLVHKPNMRGRGEIIAAYAIAVMTDGRKQFAVMSREEIDKVRNASKSKDSGPWVQWGEEMSKKSCVKRLCKLLPLSPEIQKATALDDLADAGVEQTFDIDVTVPESMPTPAIEQETAEMPVEVTVEPEPEKEPVAAQEGQGEL